LADFQPGCLTVFGGKMFARQKFNLQQGCSMANRIFFLGKKMHVSSWSQNLGVFFAGKNPTAHY
jgi:hypothetical protein